MTLGDGYLGGNVPLARIVPLVDELRAAAADAGRDPGAFRIVCRGAVRLLEGSLPDDGARRPLWGGLDQIRSDVARYAAAGLDELFLELNFDPTLAAVSSRPASNAAAASCRSRPTAADIADTNSPDSVRSSSFGTGSRFMAFPPAHIPGAGPAPPAGCTRARRTSNRR